MIWVYVIFFLASFAYLGRYLFRNLKALWHSAKGLGAAASEFGQAWGAFAHVHAPALAPIGNVYEDESRVVEAREDRERVREHRKAARRRRLSHATERWDEGQDYELFSQETRDAARAAREESRLARQEAHHEEF